MEKNKIVVIKEAKEFFNLNLFIKNFVGFFSIKAKTRASTNGSV
jgi:hypothetical protein